MARPKVTTTLAEKELDKMDEQFKAFDESIKEMTKDRLDATPKEEVESQTKLSSKEISNSKEIYLKPAKTISDKAKFNERFRKEWEFAKEYVQFIAEHREIIGDDIEMWTKPFAGVPYEFWKVPANKPVWGPRYLAEQIKKCLYHRLVMRESVVTASDGYGSYYGQMAADTTVQRLDAVPVSKRKSVFMGASNF